MEFEWDGGGGNGLICYDCHQEYMLSQGGNHTTRMTRGKCPPSPTHVHTPPTKNNKMLHGSGWKSNWEEDVGISGFKT